jgi:ribosomal protein S12
VNNFYPTQEEALQGNFGEVRMPTTLTNGRQSVQVVNKLGQDIERPNSANRKKMSTRISNRFKK